MLVKHTSTTPVMHVLAPSFAYTRVSGGQAVSCRQCHPPLALRVHVSEENLRKIEAQFSDKKVNLSFGQTLPAPMHTERTTFTSVVHVSAPSSASTGVSEAFGSANGR